ncbi:glyoxylase-like metal-dependent hydrolase (beta-lactamase superfamily II) [Rhodococcus sp. OK519]|uniref:MBL fold metallo-hydrolase n=1 Tax=Rhodococcus sp. OK519 TaxID=2135729 RepID=UPI000D445FA5|nr:glyoxylase-like metal-dependent hydrolase (beta-lactamase superfamily II) [Rhodococcus sp. OK519]
MVDGRPEAIHRGKFDSLLAKGYLDDDDGLSVTDAASHWSAPGTHEVAPGVYRIPLPLPEGPPAINVYAVVDGANVVLIDSGWATDDGARHLTEGLERIGFDPGLVSQFLITHWHTDHYSLAMDIRGRHGTPVSLGIGERNMVGWHAGEAASASESFGASAALSRAGAGHLANSLQAALQNSSSVAVELPDRWLEGSPRIVLQDRTLIGIPTPGHTNGHYSFWDPDAGLFFTGDHILPNITPWIGLESGPNRLPLSDYLASLLLVQTMPDAQLLPAHGPTTPSASQRARELIEHHHTRLNVTLEAVTSHPATALETAHRLRWTRREHRFADLAEPLQGYAVLEAVAHLDVLVHRGALHRTEVDGIALYSR